MKLWYLEQNYENIEDFDDPNQNPWENPYDTVNSYVIRAETEEKARELADKHAGDEKHFKVDGIWINVWKDYRYTTCIELRTDGPLEVVLTDYRG